MVQEVACAGDTIKAPDKALLSFVEDGASPLIVGQWFEGGFPVALLLMSMGSI